MDVIVEEKFPLRWESILDEPGNMEHLRRITANEETLRAIGLLEELHLEVSEDHDRSSDIQRVESKINIVLDLIVLMARQSMDLPPALPTRLAATFVEWQSTSKLSDGQPLLVQVYLSPKYPRPVHLIGIVESASSESIFNCRVNFISAGEVQQALLEKYIFRQHRRQVAFERRNSGKE